MQISIKALRVNAGLTQREAAEKLGVDRGTLICWEQYKSFPTIQQVEKMCRIYGCNKDDIFVPLTQS